MKSQSLYFFFLVLFSFSAFQTQAQDSTLTLCYRVAPGNTTDTVQLFLRSNTDTANMVRAINFSIAYHDSCADIVSHSSPLEDGSVWGTFLSLFIDSDSLQLSYNGIDFDSRFQYGNADPGLPNPNPLSVPDKNFDGVPVLNIVLSGSCRANIHVEDESENAVNQIGDSTLNPVDFIIEMGDCAFIGVAIENTLPLSDLAIFPNPTQDQAWLRFTAKQNANYNLVLRDVSGRKIQSQSFNVFAGEKINRSIDLSKFSTGIYLLQIFSPEVKGEMISLKLEKN